MLILYVKDYCPFSARVIREGKTLGLSFELRDIADPEIEKELIARGGKHETPYLIDTDTNIEMYDSDLIIPYLQETYSRT